MAKKTVRRKQSKKPKHSVYEKRAYYIGYGIGLARTQDKNGNNNGYTFLSSGYVPAMKSAQAGEKKAHENKDNPYKRDLAVIPPNRR